MAETAAARKNPRMQIRTLTARTSALALPLLEAQYREHHIEMGGSRARAKRRPASPCCNEEVSKVVYKVYTIRRHPLCPPLRKK